MPLANALTAMEAGELGKALIHFGECWEIDQTCRPVVVFAGESASQGYFARKAQDASDPNLPTYRQMALDLLSAAWEMEPTDAVARHNFARFLQDVGDDRGAIPHYRHALLLDAGQVETWGNLGTALYQTGNVAEAWRCWEEAIRRPTDKPTGHLSQSYIYLRRGEYAEGWQRYNARWDDLQFRQGYGRKDLGESKHWRGGPLPANHRLLLHGEQGLGDHVQFARYAIAIEAAGYTVAGIETRAVLQRFLQGSFPSIPVVARDIDPLPDFTHHVSMLDLPGILGTTLETIPAPVPPTSFGAAFNPRTPSSSSSRTLRVGIAWHGAPGNPADLHRSIPAELLIHLADIPGVTWVNLQFGDGDAMTAQAWLGPNTVDGTADCRDAMDTAAVMRGLDLVITVDTLTAHLAGTLGVPTWVLHRFCREWRWLDAGESCPWYPSVRSLTVPAPNDWPALLQQVRAELMTLVASGS